MQLTKYFNNSHVSNRKNCDKILVLRVSAVFVFYIVPHPQHGEALSKQASGLRGDLFMEDNMFTMMLENCDPDDLEQLHDILTMMAKAIDKINEVFPSTVVLSQDDNEE